LDASLKEAVEEDWRLTLFVARDVFLTPRGEFSAFYLIRHGATLAQAGIADKHWNGSGKEGGDRQQAG
jgi:hypothetical protein